MKKTLLKDIKALHSAEKKQIEKRLAEFVDIFRLGNDEKVFAELVFCLLTPQSKAKNCWQAVNDLISNCWQFDA